MPSKGDLAAAETGVESFKQIVAAMDEEERLKPELFLVDEEATLDRMDAIAEKCGKNREQIRQFIAYFLSTRKTSAQLAKGEKPADIKQQFAVELKKVPGG